jgi:hypothetical protein
MSRVDDGEESQEPEGRIILDEPPIHVTPDSPREFRRPLFILAVGLVALLASAITIGGGVGALEAGLLFAFVCLVQVPITIAVMYLLAAVLGISYGLLRSALLKLAAITIFVIGFSLVGEVCGYPILAQMALLPLSWYLFGSFFELDVWETLVSMIGFCLLAGAFYSIIRRVVAVALGWFT